MFLKKQIYLDYAASTPVDSGVLAFMRQYYSPKYSNPSALYQTGRNAGHALRRTRELIANLLNVGSSEIVFTGSGTEANNLAILGGTMGLRPEKSHVIVSSIEHKSVLEPAYFLRSRGFAVDFAPVKSNGVLDLDAFTKLVRPETKLVSVMLVNNEIGSVQPVREVSEILKRKTSGKALLHTDCCQATLLNVDPAGLGVDLLTLNSAKVYGPAGVGLLYIRKGVPVLPVVLGGGQESGMRGGTLNLPLIMGFGKALELTWKTGDAEMKRLSELREFLCKEISLKLPRVKINSEKDLCVPGIIHLTVPGVEGESIMMHLDAAGIFVSTGSACSATDLRPSHVLLAMGHNPELVHGSVRVSLGRGTRKRDLQRFVRELQRVVLLLSRISPLC